MRVTIAVLLGAACFNVLVAEIYDSYRRPTEGDPFTLADATTSINLHFGAEDVFGSVYLSLSRDEVARLQHLVAGREDTSVQGVLGAYLPHVKVGTARLEAERVSFELKRDSKYGSMRTSLRSLRLDPETKELRVRISPARRIDRNSVYTHVSTTASHVLAVNATPQEQSEKSTHFESDSQNLQFKVVREVPREKPAARIADVVRWFDSRYLYVIDPLVGGVMYSVPFLLLIALRRRLKDADVPTSGGFLPACVAMVVFFIGIGVLRATFDVYQDPVRELRDRLVDRCEPVLLYADGAAALGAAFVACYWPVFATRKRDELRRASRRTRLVFWIVFLAAAVLTAITAFAWCAGESQVDELSAATLRAWEWAHARFGHTHEVSLIAAAVATIFALAAVTAELTGGIRAIGAAIGTAVVAAAIELWNAMYDQSNAVTLIAIAVLVVPLVFAILKIILPAWSSRTRFGVAVVAAALLVLRPMPNYYLWFESATAWVAASLSPALRLIAAWFLIRILRDLSQTGEWDHLEDGERDAGIILALTFLFMPSHQWLYILVSILLGWLVLRYWIFVRRTIPKQSDTDAPATIRDVIRLNEASSALTAMKKEMRGKLAKGEVPFHEYERHVRGLEALVDNLHARLHRTGDDAPAAVLSSGQPAPPWKRAMIGARYGLLLAVPWMALFLRNFHERFAPQSGSEWVGAIGTAVQVMGQWPLVGFFFGYFYPHLRGETGLSKSIYLYLAVAAPAVAATALALPTSSPAWVSLSFWALQLFIHCMLLGLFVGDYETLRNAGLGWRHVLDVHNLGALAAWGSSLLLAIGAAATTYITSKGGTLLMQMLQRAPELTK